jgi:hypothetical protein
MLTQNGGWRSILNRESCEFARMEIQLDRNPHSTSHAPVSIGLIRVDSHDSR